MATQLYQYNGKSQFKDNSTDVLDIDVNDLQRTLKLAGMLHSSLELKTVLEYFIEAAKLKVSFQAAFYQNDELRTELQFSDAQKHSCSYNLTIDDQSLGEITFSSKKRFSTANLEILENLLCHLVHPLRNSILYQKALKAAHSDALTGLNNRGALDKVLKREVDISIRHNIPLSLIVLDIDYFKNVNDKYGHAAGDKILQNLSRCIENEIRGCDILFRYGGEEFVIVLTNTGLKGANLLAERIRHAVINEKFVINDNDIPIRISLGVGQIENNDDAEELFIKTDTALYEAKRNGRNQTMIFSSNMKLEIRNKSCQL
ncbi:MAG: GGDEF domain-containing protein [Thiohalomonadales bacterium]